MANILSGYLDLAEVKRIQALHLREACMNDNLEVVKYFVEQQGVAVDAFDTTEDTITPLHVACWKGDLELFKFLMEHWGATVDAIESEAGCTPLHHACRHGGCLELVMFLVEQGGAVDARDHDGETPLHICARGDGTSKETKFLVEQGGATVDAKCYWGNTPLYFACWYGNLEMVKCLVELGAAVDTKCDHLGEEGNAMEVKCEGGRTPLHVACEHWKVVKSVSLKIVRFLVQQGGAQVDAKDSYGRSPLHLLCAGGSGWGGVRRLEGVRCLEGVQCLVEEFDAPIDTKDNNGMTPLHEACALQNFDVVRYLVHRACSSGQLYPVRFFDWSIGRHDRVGQQNRRKLDVANT